MFSRVLVESFLLKQKIKSKTQSSYKIENKIKQAMNDCIFIGICELIPLYIHNIIPDAPSTH